MDQAFLAGRDGRVVQQGLLPSDASDSVSSFLELTAGHFGGDSLVEVGTKSCKLQYSFTSLCVD